MYDLICDVISDQTVKSEEGERQGRGAAAAEFEGRRREDRGAEGAERGRVWRGGIPLATGGAPPPQKNFRIWISKWRLLVHSGDN